ncbi:PPE domain-containing protein [Mycobacterium sp.]|uniref:PPE domain-containing protein n=1 Tax=Mycobacterium sp. TaxID=1785 RepID=UPI0031E2E11C
MGDNLRVDTSDLRAKADEINGIKWATPADESPITPPSALTTSMDAVTNLVNLARSLWEYQNWGATEGKRLAESLYHVAKAYDEVDLRAQAEINSGNPISNGPVRIDDCSIPKPAHPSAPSALGKVGHAPGDPEVIEDPLRNGDQGAALQHVAEFWRNTGDELQSAAESFHVRIRNWEGAAAEGAYSRFNQFGGWLEGMASSWQQLASQADKIKEAHRSARDAHTPVYEQWMTLKKQLETADDDQKQSIMEGLLKQYAESEHVRAQYESAATIDPVQPPEPVDGLLATPVYTNGDPRRRAIPGLDDIPDVQQMVAPLTGTPGGGGAPGGSAFPSTPVSAGTPQHSAPQQQPTAAQSAGSPSGGSGSQGGSPSGGSGGGVPGGMPAAANASPHLPKGPSLKPASTGGHGGGAGGGAGPLQPSVTGSAVAPSRGAAAHGAEAGHAGLTAPAGAAGGGGGAPIGGQGGHGQGGKEKRRTPGLSPEEELYKEEREWTEGVIGHRKRRDVQDGKDSGGSK